MRVVRICYCGRCKTETKWQKRPYVGLKQLYLNYYILFSIEMLVFSVLTASRRTCYTLYTYMQETGGQEPSRKAQRLESSTINAVADALQKQGHKTLANELRSPALSQEQIRQNQQRDHASWEAEMKAKRDAETPLLGASSTSSQNAQRLDTQDVDAALNALEQAKRFPVPQGEEPGQFYHRKAQEILSQGKEPQK